jgi:hypothetical protein
MYMTSRSVFFLLVLGIVSCVVISTAWAHKDRGPNDPCRKQIGDSFLHLTLYQPHFNPDAEYCEELPRAGKTVVVVDVTAGELRQVPISVEVVASGASGLSRTALSLPAQPLERGAVDSEMVFDEGNTYVARVVVNPSAPNEVKFEFPILVSPWYTALIRPALMIVGLLVITAISVVHYQMKSRQQEAASVGKRRIRRVAN